MSKVKDRGQAIGLVLISIVLVALVAGAMVRVSRHVTDRGRAQTAADAAALAGVNGGSAAAANAAARNGAVLIEFDRRAVADGFAVDVEVAIGDEHAVARASSGP
ncbi:MAG: hypothetical protein JWM34_2658 [Ilumatobacteraceae bacterium]|nr:hypothetical protein [Ilumatobacteraceae bacterium]